MNKLGRLTPVTRPRLKLAKFLAVDTGAAPLGTPPQVHRTDWKLPLPMLANGPDPTVTINPIVAQFGVGCCVPAAMMKAVQHMRYGAGKGVPAFTADECLALYSRLTGYDASQTAQDGSNPTDQGTEPNSAFTYWQQHGIPLPEGGVDKIAGFIAVNPLIGREWETAIAEFDVLLSGFALPRTILQQSGEQTSWTVVDRSLQGDSAPGSLGGHEIVGVSYDQLRTRDATWEEHKLISREFYGPYCDQLTAVITEDQLNSTGVSETGLDWSALTAAAASLG